MIKSNKRVFIIVMDSVGVGEAPDSADYGDAGSNTLASCARSGKLNIPNLQNLGIFNTDPALYSLAPKSISGCCARIAEASKGKDTTTGHWEIAGLVSDSPMPVFPDGFPAQFIEEFSHLTGRGVLCNKPYSGTEVIKDFGREHIESGSLIVYTSADSVLQIAAHESIVPLEELYRCCEIARGLLKGELAVGRVIARPFTGEYPDFVRTANRHDFSLEPPRETLLDKIKSAGLDCIGIGKINDIFAGRGITEFVRTSSNSEGMSRACEYAKRSFSGLCFVNLVDFDSLFGHRNDIDGYTNALNRFDSELPGFMQLLKPDDILIITADHGCDPATASTDHSREYVPMLAFGKCLKSGVMLGTLECFGDIAATAAEYLGVEAPEAGKSFLSSIML